MLVTFQAIHKFSQARPPGIYKQDYIDSLYMFFNERKPESLVCPQTPEWKSLPDPDFHGVSVSATDNYADILQQVHAHFVFITWLSFQKIWLQLVCTYDSASLVMFLFYFCSREFDIAFKYNWLHSASFLSFKLYFDVLYIHNFLLALIKNFLNISLSPVPKKVCHNRRGNFWLSYYISFIVAENNCILLSSLGKYFAILCCLYSDMQFCE